MAAGAMAEAGAFAEVLDWLRRKPVSFAAPPGGWQAATKNVTRMFVSRDGGATFVELPGVVKLSIHRALAIRRENAEIVDISVPDRAPYPLAAWNAEGPLISVEASGWFLPEIGNFQKFRIHMPDGVRIGGELEVEETRQQSDRFSMKARAWGPILISGGH